MIVIPKKWRELPLKEKLDLPVKHFGFKKEDINRIRAIDNRKQKIIESARLMFNKFGDIHSFLVAWIAGYGSDIAARQDFGSMRNLRILFVKSPTKIKGVKYSWMDLRRSVKIPEHITSELAEETGIHLGDGNLGVFKDNKGYLNFRYGLTGDLKDELIYHREFIAPLLEDLYGIKPLFLEREEKNSIETKINSRAVVEFKNVVLGLPIGSKKDAEIPKAIFNNDVFAKRCLVGIFDTDFHITSVLSISGKLHSLKLAEQVHKILGRNKIEHVYKKYKDYSRFYIPKRFASIIVKKWEMHNKKHLSKFSVFEKFGVSIPFLTTQERLDLLDGKISLEQLNKISQIRRKNITTLRGLEPRTP